jgi:CHAT domain-containing protein
MEAARVQALIGKVYQEQGSLTRARIRYETALGAFRSLSDHVNESATLYAMGTLELRESHLDAAQNYLRQSLDVTENIRRVSTSSDLTAAFSATVHERYESYIECLMRKHRDHPNLGLSVRAFEMSELARARSLAELLRTTQTNLVPGLDPKLAQQEKSLRQSLKVKEDSKVALLAKKYTRDELQALDAELARLEAEYEQVTGTIRAQYPSYEQVTQPNAWTLKQIQDDVISDDQTVLLEYSLGTDHSYVWVVTKNEIRSYDLPARARISEAAQRVYRLLSTTNDAESENESSQATQELVGMILSPVAAELAKHRVIVVSDDALNYIPFQILPSPSAGHEPLVANYEVINAPSASILGQLRRETARRQAPERVLAVFGDPVFASNYAQRKDAGADEYTASKQPVGNERGPHAPRDIEPSGEALDPAKIQPLFYARRELANLSEVAGDGTFVAKGFEATRERLAKTDLTEFAILHFATHGFLDPERPENTGLFLSTVDRGGKAQKGFVGLQDIYNLRAPVDLVVLSACRTGLGKDVRGEGLIGLARGFMYAGASSVVASLWKVDDEATAELMKRFYTNMLQGGMTPPAALRAAQNSIRQEPQWSAPYYWAAFTLQGDYHHIIKVRPTARESTRPLIMIGVVMLILLPVLFRSFRRMRTALGVASYSTVKK